MAGKQEMSIVCQYQCKLNDLLGINFPPGPNCIPWYVVINFQKGLTLPFVLALMAYFDNYSASSYFYAAAHGSYGIVWVIKHFVAPDPKWFIKTTVSSQLLSFALILGPYWSMPYLLISRTAPEPSLARCCVAMVVYIIGVVIMTVSDATKSAVLEHRRGLITSGPFKWVRHPNYLGEILLYGSFAAMVPHWFPKAHLAFVWLQVFLPNMLAKEASMSRYPEWQEYYQRTGMLLPPPSAFFRVKAHKS
jgi:protein-S-isoprenylcysteine O-methyltransferase Ste14